MESDDGFEGDFVSVLCDPCFAAILACHFFASSLAFSSAISFKSLCGGGGTEIEVFSSSSSSSEDRLGKRSGGDTDVVVFGRRTCLSTAAMRANSDLAVNGSLRREIEFARDLLMQ